MIQLLRDTTKQEVLNIENIKDMLLRILNNYHKFQWKFKVVIKDRNKYYKEIDFFK